MVYLPYCNVRSAIVLIRMFVSILVAGALLFAAAFVSANEEHEGSASDENGEGRTFRYLYLDGEHYRILSRVSTNAFVNGRHNHSEEVLNRIAVHVTDLEDGSGRLNVNWQISRENTEGAAAFALGREYNVEYERDEFGRDTVPAGAPRPMVRDVPLFPERPLEVGDTWAGEGREVVDLREGFGIDGVEEFRIPVSYEYLGTEDEDGIVYDVFELRYNMFYRIPGPRQGLYPERITGYSIQRHRWDREFGRPQAYREEFEINYDLSDGDTWTWRGTAEARITDTSFDDREEVLGELRQRFEREDIDIIDGERGITISLEDIGFQPDSTVLRAGEEESLAEIAEALRDYDEGELLITGHTALAGTAEGRRELSEARARVVAEYLIENGVRASDAVLYRGVGADEPVADNRTEAGRRRNRRVEFTILED